MPYSCRFEYARIVIYGAYDQNLPEIRSLAYLEEVKKKFLLYNYHNRKTRQQLEDCALSVFNKSRNTALAEMFNIELKFVCDGLQKSFAADLKKAEIDDVAKFNFLMNNVPQICEICDFPIDPFAETGWFQHVCSAEYLYLENIYSKKDMFKMNINEFEDFLCKVKKVLDNLEELCSSLETENAKSCQEDVSNEELDKIKADFSNTRMSRQDSKEEGPTKKNCGIPVQKIYPLFKK